jgi:pimeloyl-ACP methyl ester carboxylesterase
MSIAQSNQTLSKHYVRLYGIEKGLDNTKKPKLIFLHGLLGNSQNWAPVAKELEDDFQIVTYDLRGHGRTGKLDDQYDPEAFSDDLIAILDELEWDQCFAVGHSLGGRILMVAGSKHPERFSKLVIEDMGPHKTGEASRRTEVMINEVPVPFSNRLEAKNFFEEQFVKKHGKVLSDYLYGNLKRLESGQMTWRFDKKGALKCLEIGHSRDFWSEYEALAIKHLIIRGERSEHLTKTVVDQMKESNPFASSVEISEAGHWVHFDQRALFVKELIRFLHQ